jgi:hypothetical protein
MLPASYDLLYNKRDTHITEFGWINKSNSIFSTLSIEKLKAIQA